LSFVIIVFKNVLSHTFSICPIKWVKNKFQTLKVLQEIFVNEDFLEAGMNRSVISEGGPITKRCNLQGSDSSGYPDFAAYISYCAGAIKEKVN